MDQTSNPQITTNYVRGNLPVPSPVAAKRIDITKRESRAPLVEKLVAAGLVEDDYDAFRGSKYAWLFDRLRGEFIDEQRLAVYHPNADEPKSTHGIERLHSLDEGLKLLLDENGPEVELKQRHAAADAELGARKKADAERAEKARRSVVESRWQSFTALQRALWLVAARTKDVPSYEEDRPIRADGVKRLLVAQKRELLAELARAIGDATQPSAPVDELLAAEDFGQ